MTDKRMFEFSEGTSNKFWEVWREGAQVFTRYGKIGASGQVTVKDEGDEAKASKLHEKLIGEKTRKGYVEKTGAGPVASAQKAKVAAKAKAAAPVADSGLSELEQRLLANRDDSKSWLVYADALTAKGDPRGEVITLGEQLRTKSDAKLEALYAQKCRAARWPAGAPFPKMHYRVRFQQMIAELKAHPEIELKEAKIEKAKPKDIEKWKKVAGASWPEGMEDLYNEVSGVHIEWKAPNLDSVNGGISIPSLSLWDHDALEDELWFDFTEPDTALHHIRPIDRFVAEAYTVLYLKPAGKPARVAYHYCGEELVPTDLSYREWLEQLFRSRGVLYWVQLAAGKSGGDWVARGFEEAARMFPDFDPKSIKSKKQHKEVDLEEA